LLIVGSALVVGLLFIYQSQNLRAERGRREFEASAGPRVEVVTPTPTPPERVLSLVGEARPYASVTLYGKVSGYLKAVLVDKGDKVKKGQILAIVDSPETDKDYVGAKADARNKLAIATRTWKLRKRRLASPQEAEQAATDAEVAKARLDSLAVQKSYETLRAPFSGTVTARYADPGALVQSATSAQTGALPVVTISQVNRLRIYAYVDQRNAALIFPGLPARVTANERPEVVPGSFVQVNLVIHPPEALRLPVQTLAVVEGKTLLPIVGSDDRIHFREVRTGENDGEQVVILSGLQLNEKVALNVGNSIADGAHVQPILKEVKDQKISPQPMPPPVDRLPARSQ
jgi:membrane fusion protein (multidrug efflux system)